MRDQQQYNLENWMGWVEDELRKIRGGSAGAAISGLQILPDGTLFAQGGISVGAGMQHIAEPSQVPVPTNVQASWGASFDTIYIDVTWDAPSGYGADQVSAYLVQAVKSGGTVPMEYTVNYATSVRIEPVEPNTTYTINVAGVTRTGRNSSVGSTTITTGGDTTAPAAPSFPASPVVVGIQALAIKWNANTERDVANGAGQYRIRVSINADLSSPAYDVRQSGTIFWAGNLVAGTAYYVGVQAVDSSGNVSALGTPTGGPWTPLANVTDSSAIAFGGGNVLKNSGFEDPVNGWSNWTQGGDRTITTQFSISSSTYHGAFGTHAAQIANDGNFYAYQDVALTKGTWVLSGWVKGTSIVTSSGTPIGVCLNSEMLSGAYGNFQVLLGSVGGPSNQNIVTAGLGTFDWTRIAIRFDVTTAGTLRVYCQRGVAGTVTGTAWFDEVQIEQGDTLTGYAPRPDEILANTIQTTMIADGQIVAAKIAAGAIAAGKIAAGVVGATEIQAHSITAGQVAADTITATEIAANAITASELSANSVTATAIAANAVTTASLAADSVTAAKLAAMSIAVGKFIESSNYVSNSTGWHIDGSGNAEFNNVQIRGTLNAATFGSDLFDFVRPGGNIGARFYFVGTEDRFYIGNGMVNTGQYIAYDNLDGQTYFKGGSGWRFISRVGFDVEPHGYQGYTCGTWGTFAGYFINDNSNGTSPDRNWGMQFGTDGGSAFSNFVQGYLDSTARHVGLGNMNGGVQQVYIDCGSTNPADTRSLTRTGWITYSDPKAKTAIKPLSKTVASARDRINAIEPIQYKLRTKAGKKQVRVSSRDHIGFSAEAMKDVVPEAVHEDVCFVHVDNRKPEDVGMGIQMDALIPILWQGHREQDEEIHDLNEQLRKLTQRMDVVESVNRG